MEEQDGGMASERKTKVFLVDDNAVVRESLTDLISHETDLAVAGEARGGSEALEKMALQKPDIAVVDIDLPDMSGLELVKRLIRLHPSTHILVISMHDGIVFTEEVFRAGAKGYITKSQAADDVVLAIRRILNGGTFVSRR